MSRRVLLTLIAALFCQLVWTLPAAARSREMVTDPPPKLVTIGVVVAPPFVTKDSLGHFTGISMDLWRDLARDMGLEWKAREYDLDGLLDAVTRGNVDVGVAALSITPGREAVMDFSQPFYYTGLGIAVPARVSVDSLAQVVRTLFSGRLLLYIGSLLALLLFVGSIVWAIECRCNPGQFRPSRHGLMDGLWWSATTMTSVGYGDTAPKTLAGRIVALVWMFASVALLASFTAGITSSLTLASMGSGVHGPQDLHRVRTGAVRDSAGAEELFASHIGTVPFASSMEGLQALANGSIDAFVDDQPLLQYYVHRDFSGSIRILPEFFDPQLYGFAFPRGSQLRKTLNVALLRRLEDRQYRLELFGPYLGKGAVR